jgi:glycosyltransferase involved in cell wall biosynthesis
VSRHYMTWLVNELGLDSAKFKVIYNGVRLSDKRSGSISLLNATFPRLRPNVPIISYVGRQESEKGIDLLLYAAKILRMRGLDFQLVLCGATAKGLTYRFAIEEIRRHLHLDIHHAGTVTVETRNALFAHSRCVVCPSINGEPFGLVAVEAMAEGAPVIVPDYGGVAEVIDPGNLAGGVTFKCWDSGDLARQLERVLCDESLHTELASNSRNVAAQFSTEAMIESYLRHLNLLPDHPMGAGEPSSINMKA